MEEVFLQNQIAAMDKAGNVVLDIESLTQPSDKCSGSPKMTKALSRKGSSRMEKRNGEEQEADETSKKLVIKVGCSQLDQLKQPAMPIKVLIAPPTSVNISGVADTGDGRSRRFHRLTTINPKKILLLFASIGSTIRGACNGDGPWGKKNRSVVLLCLRCFNTMNLNFWAML